VRLNAEIYFQRVEKRSKTIIKAFFLGWGEKLQPFVFYFNFEKKEVKVR